MTRGATSGPLETTVAYLKGLETRFATDAARAGRVEVALERPEVGCSPGAELDVHDVETLLGVDVRVGAIGDAGDVVAAPDHSLTVEETRRELEVCARRAHRDRQLVRLASGNEPDLEGLLGSEVVGARSLVALPYDADAGAGPARWALGHPGTGVERHSLSLLRGSDGLGDLDHLGNGRRLAHSLRASSHDVAPGHVSRQWSVLALGTAGDDAGQDQEGVLQVPGEMHRGLGRAEPF